ncbi:MAG: hypothetical protein JWO48_807 [Bryobacterales bacterium]|nr:hypothetical protein [Bryobacterales bacterium]
MTPLQSIDQVLGLVEVRAQRRSKQLRAPMNNVLVGELPVALVIVSYAR